MLELAVELGVLAVVGVLRAAELGRMWAALMLVTSDWAVLGVR